MRCTCALCMKFHLLNSLVCCCCDLRGYISPFLLNSVSCSSEIFNLLSRWARLWKFKWVSSAFLNSAVSFFFSYWFSRALLSNCSHVKSCTRGWTPLCCGPLNPSTNACYLPRKPCLSRPFCVSSSIISLWTIGIAVGYMASNTAMSKLKCKVQDVI